MKTLTVTREVYPSYLKEKFFIAIRFKFPIQKYTPAWVKKDKARPQVSPKYIDIIAAVLPIKASSEIRMICQSLISSDFNILDL